MKPQYCCPRCGSTELFYWRKGMPDWERWRPPDQKDAPPSKNDASMDELNKPLPDAIPPSPSKQAPDALLAMTEEEIDQFAFSLYSQALSEPSGHGRAWINELRAIGRISPELMLKAAYGAGAFHAAALLQNRQQGIMSL